MGVLISSHNGDAYTPGELRAAGDHSSRPRTDAYSHNTHRDGDSRSSHARSRRNSRGHNSHGDMHACDICDGSRQRSPVLAVVQ